MNLVKVMERFPGQESYIEHLEQENETQEEDEVGRTGRYNCHACRTSFKGTQGPVFHGTKILLQKWFATITLILNVKKGISSYQLQRDLGLKQKAAWYILTCIRAEMGKKQALSCHKVCWKWTRRM